MDAVHDDAPLIPLAGRLDHGFRWSVQGEVTARRVHGLGSVLAVVGDLILRPGLVGLPARFVHAVEHAAVFARRDLPVEAEFKAAVGLHGHEVAAWSDQDDRAVDRLPARRHLCPFVAAPSRQALAVEEGLVTGRLFLGRQFIRSGMQRG